MVQVQAVEPAGKGLAVGGQRVAHLTEGQSAGLRRVGGGEGPDTRPRASFSTYRGRRHAWACGHRVTRIGGIRNLPKSPREATPIPAHLSPPN